MRKSGLSRTVFLLAVLLQFSPAIAEETGTLANDLKNAREFIDMGLYAGAAEYFEKALVSVSQLPQDDPTIPSVYLEIGDYYRDQKNFDKAHAMYANAIAIRELTNDFDNPMAIETMRKQADLNLVMGNLQDADPLIHRAVRLSESHLGRYHIETGRCLNVLADYYLNIGNFRKAEGFSGRAFDIIVAEFGEMDFQMTPILGIMAEIYEKQGLFKEATPYRVRTVEILTGYKGPQNSEVSDAIRLLGRSMLEVGNLEGAESNFQLALTINERLYGDDDKQIAVNLLDFSDLEIAFGEFKDAIPYCKKALRLLVKPDNSGARPNLVYDGGTEVYFDRLELEIYSVEDQPLAARAISNLGYVRFKQDDLVNADSLLRLAVKIKEHSLGGKDPSIAIENLRLAQLNLQLDKSVEAEDWMIGAITNLDHKFGSGNYKTAEIQVDLAKLYIKTDRLKEADKMLKQSLGNREMIFGKNSLALLPNLEALAEVYDKLGKKSKTEKMLARIKKIKTSKPKDEN